MSNELKELDHMTPAEMVKTGMKKGFSTTIRKPGFKRFVFLLLVFCIGFGFGVYQCYKHMTEKEKVPGSPELSVVASTPPELSFMLTISHVEEIIRPASDLITTKYTYTDADTYEDYKQFFNMKLPFTTNKVVFTYSGEIGIGLDLAQVTIYLDNDRKIITITLPKIGVKYNEIDADSFEYYNVSSTIFNQLKMEDATDLIATLLAEKEKQILNDKNVMDSARANTEMVLKSLLSNSELTKEYEIIFS